MDEIIELLKKWLFFGLFCFLYLFLFDKENLFYKDIFPWLIMKAESQSDLLISLDASMYFFIYYIQVSIVISSLLYFVKKFIFSKEMYNKVVFYFLLMLFFVLISINYSIPYFGLSSYFVAYSIFYIIGYLSMEYNFTSIKSFIAFEALLLFIILFAFHFYGYEISDLQSLKMSMNFLYPLISLPSLFLVIYLRDKAKYGNKLCRLINFIGKDALFMFFAQGLSSSLLFYIVPLINIKLLWLKILVMFIINFIIAILFFLFLLYSYKWISKLLKKIIEKYDIWNFFLL